MRELRFSRGYLHWTPGYGTVALETSESNMWGIGSSEPKNIGAGLGALAVKNPIIRPCFATEIPGSVKLVSGKKAHAP